MRKFRFIFLLVAVLLGTGACARLDEPQASLDIFIRFPDQSETKAGSISPENEKETRIVDLRIWVFGHSSSDPSLNGKLLGFLAPTRLDYTGTTANKFTILIDKNIAGKISTADVYVLANAKSAGLDNGDGKSPVMNGTEYKQWSDLSASELDGIVMSGNAFGIKLNTDATTYGPTNTGVLDSEGVPFSAVGKGLNITGSGSHLSVAAVELVRAVSKVQFVFSQFMDSEGVKPAEFTIVGLKLNGNKLAKEEPIFPSTTYSGGYLENDLSFPVSAYTKTSIAGYLNPADYECQNGESAQDYRDRINDGISKGRLTRGPLCYLRESDQRLEGVFTYILAGETENKEVTFRMAEGETFSRNRSWIVYIYFMNDRMGFSVRVLEDGKWKDGGQYDFEVD